jgi:hypothetical protein
LPTTICAGMRRTGLSRSRHRPRPWSSNRAKSYRGRLRPPFSFALRRAPRGPNPKG